MKDKTRKDIIIIISYIALVIFALVNFSKILAFLGKVISIFSPFLLGIILAFVLNVLNNFIEKKIFGKIKPSKIWNKIKRPLCITLSLILVFLTIFFVMNLLIPQLKNSASLFTDTLPAYKEDIIGILNKFDVDESTVNNIISKGIITLVFAIYMIAQKETLSRQINKVMKAYLKPKTINKINTVGTLANKTFSNFVTGQCLEALIFGSLVFVGMLIFRFPYASTIGVLLGFTALIPIFGAFIGTAIGFILIMMVSPVKAILFVVFIIVLQQI